MWLSAHVHGGAPTLNYEELLRYFSFCSLSARREQQDLMFLVRIFKNKIDSSILRSYFGLSVPSRPSRQLTLFAVPFARVDTIKRSMFCRLPRVANEFLRTCTDVDIFDDSFCSIRASVKLYARAATM